MSLALCDKFERVSTFLHYIHVYNDIKNVRLVCIYICIYIFLCTSSGFCVTSLVIFFFFFGFKHCISFIFLFSLHLLCAQTPCVCGDIHLPSSKVNHHWITQEKDQDGERKREKKPTWLGANSKCKNHRKSLQENYLETSEHGVSKSHISIFTFIKELYKIVSPFQFQLPFPKDAQSKRKHRGK